ncbi:MAG: TIGR03016 family PEP-CTERM system-associated outer membrane protein [Gammaproteobacteria bacterium]|nr:TIGR03016 family PEP-CTERM system-associated outer membrane protein [Gammaproteobacteria bacterium]MDH3768597.1 TIGR03016 family PEP-CTERM system-associated outer membrane protein [Gammaproteobacteria bacterium]
MGRIRGIAFVTGILCCSTVLAVEWEVEPSIIVAETYTDNLELDTDALKDDEFVTEIKPELKLTAVGKRFDIEFDYRLQGLIFSRRDDLDEVLNYSRTRGTAQLIGDSVFIDFSGSLGQQIVNPEGRIGISGITPGQNRNEVGYFRVNPYFQRQLGRNSNIVVGYQYGLVEYDDVSLVDSESNGLSASISGTPPSSSWSWRIDADSSRIDYDSGARVDLQRIGGEFSWSLGKTAIFVGGGDEDNEFNQILGASKIDGAFWNVGLRGDLDRLTTFSISVGEQHFGDSYSFSLKRAAGLLQTDISYLEETTTIGQQQQGYEALFKFLSNITGVELPTPGAEVYVRKRLSTVATLELARSRYRFNAYSEDRDYLTTALGDSDGIFGVALSWTWTALPRTEFSVDAGWQRFDLRSGSNDPEDVRLQFRLQREIKNGFFVNARVWQNSRFSTAESQEYTENTISVGVGKRF